jgi:hypothetical protein
MVIIRLTHMFSKQKFSLGIWLFSFCHISILASAQYHQNHFRDWVATLNFTFEGNTFMPCQASIDRSLGPISASNSIQEWHMFCARELAISRAARFYWPQARLAKNTLFAMISVGFSENGTHGRNFIWHFPIREDSRNELRKFLSISGTIDPGIDPYNGHSEGALINFLQGNIRQQIMEVFLHDVGINGGQNVTIKFVAFNIASYMDACFNCRSHLKHDLGVFLSNFSQVLASFQGRGSVSLDRNLKLMILYSGLASYAHINAYEDADTRHFEFDSLTTTPPLNLPEMVEFYHLANPYELRLTGPQPTLAINHSRDLFRYSGTITRQMCQAYQPTNTQEHDSGTRLRSNHQRFDSDE